MGLDMYLTKKSYLLSYGTDFQVSVKRGDQDVTAIKPERVKEISEELMYWRKSNWIHAWFVKNVQKGQDNCSEHEVSVEQLEELVKACKAEIDAEDTLLAGTFLPPQEGFFFGGTELNEWYYDDLKETVEKLTSLIEELKQTENGVWSTVYYCSSW